MVGRPSVSARYLCRERLLRHGRYADIRSAVAFLGERNGSVNQGEERVVFTHAHILAGIMHRTPLTDDDVARLGKFAAEQFHAESFALRFTAVLGATYTFFVCHFLRILRVC